MGETDEFAIITGEMVETGELSEEDELSGEMVDDNAIEVGEELGGEVLGEEVLEVPFGITINPVAGYRTDQFKVTVFGTPEKTRKVKICTTKPGYYRLNDPVLAERVGDGDVYVSGFTVVRGLGLREDVENQVWMYGQADIPYRTDKYTESAPVRILPTPAVVAPPEPVTPEIPGEVPPCPEGKVIGEYICKGGKWIPYSAPPVTPPGVPPAAPPKYLTTAEADERVRTGLPVYIKCVMPLLDMLPGLPYAPWIPILPGFALTREP